MIDVGTVRVDATGMVWDLYYRVCEPEVYQFVWVPVIDPEDLAGSAYDEVRRLVQPPTITLSPGVDATGFVNIETWLAVEPMDPVSATAGPLPSGLAATTTATPVAIEWDTGDASAGMITCEPWGAIPSPGADVSGERAPCGWTPTVPSTPEFGVEGGAFTGSVTIVWHVTWTASTGETGDFGELRTSTPTSYRVREIQTVGVSG